MIMALHTCGDSQSWTLITYFTVSRLNEVWQRLRTPERSARFTTSWPGHMKIRSIDSPMEGFVFRQMEVNAELAELHQALSPFRR